MGLDSTTLYSLMDLGTLGGPGAQQPMDINHDGVVAGRAFSPLGWHAFRHKNSQLDDLTPQLTGATSVANGLNDLTPEQIVGHVDHKAALWNDASHLDLSSILGSPYSVAMDINDQGMIAGSAGTGGLDQQAFRLSLQSQQHDTLLFPGHNHSTAGAINGHGDVVGHSAQVSGFNLLDSKAFFFDGTMHEIPAGDSIAYLDPYDVNDDGLVVGLMTVAIAGWPPSGFVYDGTDVEPIYPPPYPTNMSIAHGINGQGWIVGYNNSASGDNAWVRRPDGTVRDLNELLFGSEPEWHLRSAWAINDKGQIVGEGTLKGAARMFLLEPLDLPTGLASELTIDPLALALSDVVYAKLKLPDPPPLNLVKERAEGFLRGLQPSQRQSALDRIRAYSRFFQDLERELTAG